MFTLFQKLNISSLLMLGAFLIAYSSAGTAGEYDDWWICADTCGEEDAACVDACTDDFNSTHDTGQCAKTLGYHLVEQKPVPLKLQVAKTKRRPAIKDIFAGRCPAGTVPSQFDMPIYDGLFVVDFEKVWFCLDEDLEPAG